MSNYNPLVYADTDSETKDAYTKQILNSVYGTNAYMNREYISVIVDGSPTVIFKRNIIAVTKAPDYTEIICAYGNVFYTNEDYASVVKKIIG